MKISDLSVTADSGWRDVSDSRVAELIDTFVKRGLYGVGILRRPQVVRRHCGAAPALPAGGAGEQTPTTVPAAIANAFFDATGVRMREAPLNPARIKKLLSKNSLCQPESH